MKNLVYEFGATPLGAIGITASWRRPINKQLSARHWPSVSITSASSIDEGVYTPASDVHVSGVDALLALRDAIHEALKEVAS